jgi:hypothetical protein
VSALTAVIGSLIAYYLASYIQGVAQFLVPFAAGGFIYIAATDLMPELHKRTQAKESLIQLVTISTGIGLMLFLKILVPWKHNYSCKLSNTSNISRWSPKAMGKVVVAISFDPDTIKLIDDVCNGVTQKDVLAADEEPSPNMSKRLAAFLARHRPKRKAYGVPYQW